VQNGQAAQVTAQQLAAADAVGVVGVQAA